MAWLLRNGVVGGLVLALERICRRVEAMRGTGSIQRVEAAAQPWAAGEYLERVSVPLALTLRLWMRRSDRLSRASFDDAERRAFER